MSNSDQLRQTITEHPIANDKSDQMEKEIDIAIFDAVAKLKTIYYNYKIFQESTLKKKDINAHLKSLFLDENIGANLTSSLAHIRPDGGFIYVKIGDKKLLLGAAEGKTQGTNDKRLREGKGKQSLGNAIERAAKNFLEIDHYYLDEDIFSYLIFANGCDLEEPTAIRDRLTSLNLGSPFNRLYIQKISDKSGILHSRASIFIGISAVGEMSDIIFEMLDMSMKYYLKKYVGENYAV